MEDKTFITSRRRRRSHHVDPCLGDTPPSAEPAFQAFITSPALKHASPAPPSLSPFLLNIQKEGRLPRLLGDNTLPESDFPSPPTSPVVTVEAFLQRSAAKRVKTYKKRKRPVPLIRQSEEDDKNDRYENSILPMGDKKRARRVAKILPQNITKSRVKKTGLVSGLTCATQVTNVPVDPKGLYNADDHVESLFVPFKFSQAKDLDIPCRNTTKPKGRRSLKWTLIDPKSAHTSGFPSPTFYTQSLQSCLSSEAPDSGLKPLTYWSKNYSATDLLPSILLARGSKEKVSSHASAPLQFVSWEEHENGLRQFKMQHITKPPKSSRRRMLQGCPRLEVQSALDSAIPIKGPLIDRTPLEIQNPINNIDPYYSPKAITEHAMIHTELSVPNDFRSIHRAAGRVERLATNQFFSATSNSENLLLRKNLI